MCLLFGACVAKGKKQNDAPASEPPVDPLPQEEDRADYTEHLLVPLAFKQRLDRIALKVNQERKRKRLEKRPLGWFVVTQLEGWLAQMEAETGQADPKG